MGERHQFRAKWHDYNGGVYFVTICSHQKRHTFGTIVGTRFFASTLGSIIDEHINNIPSHYDDVAIVNYVIMPNHIHLVVAITSNETYLPTSGNLGCLRPPLHGEAVVDFHHNSKLAITIGAFKAGVTGTARTRKIASLQIWQKRFHEHIIQNQHAFDKIMYYIDTNVENWNKDCFYG